MLLLLKQDFILEFNYFRPVYKNEKEKNWGI